MTGQYFPVPAGKDLQTEYVTTSSYSPRKISHVVSALATLHLCVLGDTTRIVYFRFHHDRGENIY